MFSSMRGTEQAAAVASYPALLPIPVPEDLLCYLATTATKVYCVLHFGAAIASPHSGPGPLGMATPSTPSRAAWGATHQSLAPGSPMPAGPSRPGTGSRSGTPGSGPVRDREVLSVHVPRSLRPSPSGKDLFAHRRLQHMFVRNSPSHLQQSPGMEPVVAATMLAVAQGLKR